MRILITGANGQLGRALQNTLRAHEVLAYTRIELDLTSDAELAELISQNRDNRALWPDAIIHSAALTDTALCEREPDQARAVNGEAVRRLAEFAYQRDAPFLTISTNEVFDGLKGASYQEVDAPAPLNAYGVTKLAGERHAVTFGAEGTIIRTSWLYGGGGNDFIAKVLAAANEGNSLRFVTDEVATPTSADDLAEAIAKLIGALGYDTPFGGIYHLTNEGEASRYDWACEILRLAGLSDVPVEPITTEELYASGYDGPRKPRYSVLANTRARALGITMRDWREALADYFAKSRVAADA